MIRRFASQTLIAAACALSLNAVATEGDPAIDHHPAHVQAFLGVCLDAVLKGKGAQAVTERLNEKLGQPVEREPFVRFLPDEDLTAWAFNTEQGFALVVQPQESASCHVSVTQGNTDAVVEFFEQYTKSLPQGFAMAYDEVRPITDDDGEQTHWVRVVVWSLPNVPAAGLMTTMLIPSAGSSDTGLIGVFGTELVSTAMFSQASSE